jgi:outer membrane lipoprotein-sorting protein
MGKVKTWGVFALVLPLAATPATAQEAKEILGKVRETYTNLQSCHLEGSILAETRAGRATSKYETHFEIAVVKPNKVKVEFQYPGAGSWLRVSDGKTMYRYRSLNKQLKQEPASPYDLDVLKGTVISNYENILDGLKSAQLKGSEPAQVGDKSADCYVVEAQYQRRNEREGVEPLPTKYWIDKARSVLLRQVSGTRSTSGGTETENIRTTSFSLVQINQPVPDTVFLFNAPKKK